MLQYNNSITGYLVDKNGKKKNDDSLSAEEFLSLYKQMEFVYIESINTFIPDLIGKITDGIIDVEYDKSRFSQSKKELKEAYDTYIDGLSTILGNFVKKILSIVIRVKRSLYEKNRYGYSGRDWQCYEKICWLYGKGGCEWL